MKAKYQGKRTAHRISKRVLLTLLALVMVLGVSVGGTLAWLSKSTTPVTNTFTMGVIVPDVDEEFGDHVTKTNVKIQNTSASNIPAFLRVALIPTWEQDGKPVGEEASLSDLDIVWGTEPGSDGGKWVTDGMYYYYTVPVPAGDSTANLIDKATVKTSNGYSMNLQIIVDAIQPTEKAVEAAWPGVNVTADTDGGLSISVPTGTPGSNN